MSEQQAKMLSIWFFVSVGLGMFGLIILGMGIYYAVAGTPVGPVLSETNPSLWWGAVMVASSVALFLGDRLSSKRQAD